MPNYVQKCGSCGHIFEQFRRMADFDQYPPCPKCDGESAKHYLPSGASLNAPAVVVYKTPDGTFRFPGDTNPNGRTAKQYSDLGYERVELKGWADVRRMEGQVSKQQASEIRQRVERQCEMRERSMSDRRSEIRRSLEQGFVMPETDEKGRETGRTKVVRMGQEARDFVRAAVERNDGKPRPREFESGFHVDVYSQNRGNRDEGRRPDGKRWRD